MEEEYIIINKTTIQKGIEKWEIELQECFKAPVGEFDSDYVSTLQQAITTAREILFHSTPLVPEIEKIKDNLFQKLRYWREDIHSEDELYDLIDEELDNHISNLKH